MFTLFKTDAQLAKLHFRFSVRKKRNVWEISPIQTLKETSNKESSLQKLTKFYLHKDNLFIFF